MPAFEFSSEHQAFVKACYKCEKLFIGTRSQQESEKLFRKHFNYREQNVDGFDHTCRTCKAIKERTNHIKRTYDITPGQFEAMWVNQNGLCAICDVILVRGNASATSVCVDHCNATSIIRGLLCHRCNSAIGLLDHDQDRLESAIRYLDGVLNIVKKAG